MSGGFRGNSSLWETLSLWRQPVFVYVFLLLRSSFYHQNTVTATAPVWSLTLLSLILSPSFPFHSSNTQTLTERIARIIRPHNNSLNRKSSQCISSACVYVWMEGKGWLERDDKHTHRLTVNSSLTLSLLPNVWVKERDSNNKRSGRKYLFPLISQAVSHHVLKHRFPVSSHRILLSISASRMLFLATHSQHEL